LIEVFNWHCPLTLLEYELRRRGGVAAYDDSFLAQHLNHWIYWDVPQRVLITVAFAVVVVNTSLYAHWALRNRRGDARSERADV
jgi:hypothetical protein